MSRTETRKAGRPAKRQGSAARVTKADISRDRVLSAAAMIFAERGYAGTTMRSVAKRVGLQAASLYYHYRSKEELIEAVLDFALSGVSGAVRMAVEVLPPGSSARELLNTAIVAHLTSVLGFGDFALATRRVLGQVPPHVRRKHMVLRDAYSDYWLVLLDAAQQAGELRAEVDLHLARTFVLGALNSALDWYKPQGKRAEDVAEQFSMLVTSGIFKQPAP